MNTSIKAQIVPGLEWKYKFLAYTAGCVMGKPAYFGDYKVD